MIYLASPYSSSCPITVTARFQATEKFIALHLPKTPLFSPIVHCHSVAVNYKLPTDADAWMDYNTAFLSRAEQMWVLQLDGWQKSVGVRAEIDYWVSKHRQSFCIQMEKDGYRWLEYTKTG